VAAVQDAQVIAFDSFFIDARQRLLFNANGESLPLPSRAFDTLLFMAQHPHELIDKQRLMKAVWPQAIVEENNLSQHISLIRKVLGEAPNQHRFIVTVPGRGFRFVPQVRALEALPWLAAAVPAERAVDPPPHTASADVVVSPEPSHHSRTWMMWAAVVVLAVLLGVGYRWLNRPPPADSAPSIAVLAFADMSPGHDQEYFSDGLADELINQLGQIPQLRVIGRTSSFAFKGRNEDSRRIGEILGVNHILEGSVRKSGDRVRITALLINSADGSQLWSETYERKLDDIFAIQDEISHTVAARLQLKLGVQDLNAGGTRNLAAYDEFLTARAMLNSNDDATLRAAAPHLEQAVMLDPEFMTARLWLIDAYLRAALSSAELKDAAIAMQEAAIDEVVKRARGTPEASFALSYRAARGSDLVELERLLKDAMRIQGSPGARARLRYGQFLMGTGNSAAALRELRAVQRDDPLNDFSRTQILLALENAGQSAQAEQEIQGFLRTPGGNTRSIHGVAIRMAQGQHDTARLQRAVQAAIDSGYMSGEAAQWLRQMLASPADALEKLRRSAAESHLQGDVYFASNIAQDAAFLGDKQLALEGMKALLNSNFAFETTAFVLWRPVLRDVRSEPAFKALLRERGLAQYWRTTGNWGDSCRPLGSDDFECR
jgi:TolB-like protein/DNA-binding winged helix-turn-helix (wHTH) protein